MPDLEDMDFRGRVPSSERPRPADTKAAEEIFGRPPLPATTSEAPPPTEGLRFNKGKDPWHLLAWDAIEQVVLVCKFGTTKYDERNWEKGLKWDETYGSLQRHATRWYLGERFDPETKLPHLAHVAWNALALLAFELRGMVQFDNRPCTKKDK